MIFIILINGKKPDKLSKSEGLKICNHKFTKLRTQDQIRRFPPLNIFL